MDEKGFEIQADNHALRPRAVLLAGDHAVIAQVGDSRAYLLRDGIAVELEPVQFDYRPTSFSRRRQRPHDPGQ